jgi:thioredoxin-related protein
VVRTLQGPRPRARRDRQGARRPGDGRQGERRGDPDLADRFGVKALPSLLFFKNGALAQTLVGAVPKKIIVERLTSLRD